MNFWDINFLVAGLCWFGFFILCIEVSNIINKKYKKIIIEEFPYADLILYAIRLCLIFSIPIINAIMLFVILFNFETIKQKSVEAFEEKYINETVIDLNEEDD